MVASSTSDRARFVTPSTAEKLMSNRSALLITRPRRYTGRLAAIDAARRRHDPVVLGRPLQARGDLFQNVSFADQHAVDDVDGRQRTALVAVAACTCEHEVRQAIDAHQRPRQHVIDRIVGRQMRVAVEAMRPERILERFAHSGQRRALTSEQMPGDIRDFGVEELVHPTHVVDPHDLQRRLEQPRESSETVRQHRA